MPAVDRSESQEGGERGKKSSSSKTKDLSHVPCKFFKVGSCTAGSSCPFSHAVAEPGAQKDVCAWFVKGNCKFGHKCALAHVLPGQPMTMDRKNKKAAQLAAGGGGKESGKGGGRSSKRDTQGRPPITMSLKASISPSAPAPALKDTDFASFGALDESNKLPSAPAHGKQSDSSDKPASKENQTPSSPNVVPVSSPRRSNNPDSSPTQPAKDFGPIGSPPRAGPSATSPPSHPHPISRLASNANGSNGGFSPGTSPSSRAPNGSGTPTKNSSAFLSTSPFSAPGSQSIFLNYSEVRSGGGVGGVASSLGSGLAVNSGIGMSRGASTGANTNTSTGNNANPSWGSLGNSSDIGSLPVLGGHVPPRLNGTGSGTTGTSVGKDFDLGFEYEEYLDSGIAGGVAARRAAVSAASATIPAVTGDGEDGDMEDFLPSSLTDLLTPEERSRRMSRSNSGQGEGNGLTSPTKRTLGVPLGGQGSSSGNGNGHRYSRSVPAPSLLGDISSIWSNNSTGVDTPTSSGLPSSPSRLGGFVGNGTPSSFTSASGMLHDDFGLSSSPSLLSPSNASAAFLPGLHHQYLKSKQQQGLSALSAGLGRGVRGVSNPLFGGSGQVSSNASSSRLGVPTGSSPSAPSPLSAYGTPKTADNALSNYTPSTTGGLGSQLAQQQHHPIPSHLNSSPGLGGVEDPHILSPSSRALQAHAPGQSLPQGLAAGYSRIHALPPVASPGSIGSGIGSLGATGFSISPGVVGAFNVGPYGSTNTFSGSTQQQQQEWNTPFPPGLGVGQMSSAQYQHYLNTGLSSQNNSNNATSNSDETGAGSSEFDAMMSKLSYSAAASRGGPATSGAVLTPQRNASSSRWGQPNTGTGLGAGSGATSGALSPLSVPVTTGDDDDLFVLDR